jgi:predicted phosphatase
MRERSEKQATFPVEANQTDEEILRVKGIIVSFLIALRKYSLYPEDNSICKEALLTVINHIQGFLSDYECLRLSVEKDRFLFQGSSVYQDKEKEPSLAFRLYCEGIQWFEFQKGFTSEELNSFLRMLNRYRNTKEEAEDDLVTALWESPLPHLQYKVDDVLWEAEPLSDLSCMKANPDHVHLTENSVKERVTHDIKTSISAPVPLLYSLTPSEEKQIQDMILEEETRNSTKDALDVLIIILKEQRDPNDFASNLGFLIEEFRYDFSQCEFYFIWQFLEKLSALKRSVAMDKPWIPSMLDDFLRKISSTEVLGILEEARPQIKIMNEDQWEALRQALLLLPSQMMLTFSSILVTRDFPRIEEMLMEIMSSHADRSLAYVKQLLEKAEEPLIRRLIHILRSIREQDPTELLLKLTRHHWDAVRKDAISALVARDPQHLRTLFPLLEDPQISTRNYICEQLGKRRSSVAEELLLDYLENRRFKLRDQKHLLACYGTLGRCASIHSLPFLQKSLLRKDWKTLLGISSSLHLRGAALALMMMNEEEARAILKTASRSLYRGMRLAYRQAAEDSVKMKLKG